MIPAPFKCAGGKTKLVEALREHAPANWTGYAEPFLGGGALFRSLASTGDLDGRPVWLSDASAGTHCAWKQIQVAPDFVEEQLMRYEDVYAKADEEARLALFLKERAVWNSGGHTAARHIFLRNTGFNGLWRVNKLGRYNVPWGKYKSFRAPDIQALSKALQGNVVISHTPYARVLEKVEPGWWVYLDPPYLHEFDQYTQHRFPLAAQVDLLKACQSASARGVHVLYSNRWSSDTLALLEEHWPSATADRLVRPQTVAASSSSRGAVEELVAW
jgi:DNA adenine methylase